MKFLFLTFSLLFGDFLYVQDSFADRDNPAKTIAQLGYLILNENGRPKMMNHYDAEKFCSDRGTRLPTIHELVQLWQKFGAPPTRPTAFPGFSSDEPRVREETLAMIGENYWPVFKAQSKPHSGPRTVDFYSSSGDFLVYDQPLIGSNYWSTSYLPKVEGDASNDEVYLMMGERARIDFDGRHGPHFYGAAICVHKP
jgi:hypothetical protein